jgi:hypothetical protein
METSCTISFYCMIRDEAWGFGSIVSLQIQLLILSKKWNWACFKRVCSTQERLPYMFDMRNYKLWVVVDIFIC